MRHECGRGRGRLGGLSRLLRLRCQIRRHLGRVEGDEERAIVNMALALPIEAASTLRKERSRLSGEVKGGVRQCKGSRLLHPSMHCSAASTCVGNA